MRCKWHRNCDRTTSTFHEIVFLWIRAFFKEDPAMNRQTAAGFPTTDLGHPTGYENHTVDEIWRAYKKEDEDGLGKIKIGTDVEDEDKQEKAKILCKHCGNKITSNDARTPVAGKQQHVFSNPSGFVYEIGCFSFAFGCVNHGPPTLEFTWFAGYAWRFSLCSACHAHLGWFYQSRENSFYGLILDCLIEGY